MPRLRRVIDEIVREQFFEEVESSSPLNLFGISTDNGFCGFGSSGAAHLANLFESSFAWLVAAFGRRDLGYKGSWSATSSRARMRTPYAVNRSTVSMKSVCE